MRIGRGREYGGKINEFIVIAEGLIQESDANTVAANVVEAMKEPFILEQCSINITTSIGVALYHGKGDVTARDLIKLADDLLYKAKADGRDRFVCASIDD